MRSLIQSSPKFNITIPNSSLPGLPVKDSHNTILPKIQGKSVKQLDRVRQRSPYVARLADLYDEWSENEVPSEKQRVKDLSKKLQMCCEGWELGLRASGKPSARPMVCHVKFCPNCSAFRAARFAAKFAPHIEAAERAGHRVRFLTLTVPNVALGELRKGIKELFAAWSKLRRQQLFKDVIGSLAALDMTINRETGEANHHLHIILLGGGYIPRPAIVEAWELLTGGFIVDIRDTDKKKLKELLKYQLKVSDIQDWQQLEKLSSALAGINALRATGILRGLNRVELDDDIELDEDDELDPIIERFGIFHREEPTLEGWLNGSISVDEMRARSKLRVM